MKSSSVPGWLSWTGQVVSWLVILGVGALFAVALLVPRLAGATPYVIETGSMTPKLPPGTLVVVKPVAPEQIAPGDVITYQIKSGDPTVVTHRVIDQGVDMTGQVRWHTQGDANDAADEGWVLPQQVKGREWYAVPYVGYVTSFVTGQQRGVLIAVVVLGLLGYAANQFRGSLKERRAKTETVETS
ncbi:signal peptidase I [Nocardioides luti]|nr:signal peptidase I [Nocardioides luti]